MGTPSPSGDPSLRELAQRVGYPAASTTLSAEAPIPPGDAFDATEIGGGWPAGAASRHAVKIGLLL
jgi:hypothetical protein